MTEELVNGQEALVPRDVMVKYHAMLTWFFTEDDLHWDKLPWTVRHTLRPFFADIQASSLDLIQPRVTLRHICALHHAVSRYNITLTPRWKMRQTADKYGAYEDDVADMFIPVRLLWSANVQLPPAARLDTTRMCAPFDGSAYGEMNKLPAMDSVLGATMQMRSLCDALVVNALWFEVTRGMPSVCSNRKILQEWTQKNFPTGHTTRIVDQLHDNVKQCLQTHHALALMRWQSPEPNTTDVTFHGTIGTTKHNMYQVGTHFIFVSANGCSMHRGGGEQLPTVEIPITGRTTPNFQVTVEDLVKRNLWGRLMEGANETMPPWRLGSIVEGEVKTNMEMPITPPRQVEGKNVSGHVSFFNFGDFWDIVVVLSGHNCTIYATTVHKFEPSEWFPPNSELMGFYAKDKN